MNHVIGLAILDALFFFLPQDYVINNFIESLTILGIDERASESLFPWESLNLTEMSLL
jgi:hypothetical protein